jgi:hypothetical protein
MLSGESWFHTNPGFTLVPLWGYEAGSLMTGSKKVDHWTIGTMCQCIEIAGSAQGSPPAANEAGRRTCTERETGTKELCEIKWDYHIVGTTA